MKRMITKYIKDTNEQYSIREDGEVIMHYKLTNARNKTKIGINKLMTKYGMNSKYITISIDSSNKSISINTLLQEYFNYKLCTQCSTKITTDKVKCIKCIRRNVYDYNTLNRHKYKEQKLLKDKKGRDELKDHYVASLMRGSVFVLPIELIEAKRQQIILHREIS